MKNKEKNTSENHLVEMFIVPVKETTSRFPRKSGNYWQVSQAPRSGSSDHLPRIQTSLFYVFARIHLVHSRSLKNHLRIE